MKNFTRQLTVVVAATVVANAWTTLAAQAPGAPPSGQIDACSLLTVADVRRITGMANIPDNTSGHAPGEGVGGGSSCIYGGKSVSGVGEAAYSYVGLQGLTLWVRKGPHTLATAVEIKPPATVESVKPTAVAVARAAVAKLP